MTTILIRTFIVYIFFIISIKLMGKRQVGEIQVSELVITLLMSEAAAYPIIDPDIPLLYSIIPIIALLSIEVIMSYLGTKNKKFKFVFEPSPCILIEHGLIKQENLKKVRFTIEELISEIRLKGYPNLFDVDYAILESNGKLSVLPKAEFSQPTLQQLSLPTDCATISFALILSGELNQPAISDAGKSYEWVLKKVSDNGYKSVSDIFLMIIDNTDNLYIQAADKNQ